MNKLADELHVKQFEKEKQMIDKVNINHYTLLPKERFKGNINLRKSNVKITYTKEHIIELKKCHEDPIYFINNYCYIVNLDEGLMKFKTRDYQEKLINLFHNNKRVIVKQSRQSGKTITTAAYAVWQAIFQPYSQIGILANKAMSARGILQKIRLMYESLPPWIQSGILTWNKGKIELENGSMILASATSSSAIRSMSISTLIIDECAFIDKGVWVEFFESVFPTVSSSKNSKILLISTPKGMNHFYKFWQDAINKRSDFIQYEIGWDDVPGRDIKFKQNVIDEFGISYWNQEFACVDKNTHIEVLDTFNSKIKYISIEELEKMLCK